MKEFAGKHILIIVENLPVPFDRRVWQEAQALKKSGYQVSIISPKDEKYNKKYERLDGIDIYRHPLGHEAEGAIGYLIEYGNALFWELFLSIKIFLKNRFHVIHGCNPPDLIFLIALPFKLFKVKFVFDHHDVNPELYEAKFNKRGFFYNLMLLFEKLTFKTADYSIATNESYKKIAIERGNMNPNNVAVIRSAPSLERIKIVQPNIDYKKGKKYLIGYVGVIGEQEGIDLLLEVVKILKNKNISVSFAIIGGGTYLNKSKSIAKDMDINDYVTFYGRVSDEKLIEILNTADICVNPDKPTAMNNLSTMNKIMEYMALKKPIVQFNLKEGKFSAKEASLYANSIEDFANKITELLKNESLRKRMGEYGYIRLKNELSLEKQNIELISFYQKVFQDKLLFAPKPQRFMSNNPTHPREG